LKVQSLNFQDGPVINVCFAAAKSRMQWKQ